MNIETVVSNFPKAHETTNGYTPGPEMYAYPITSTHYVNGEEVTTVTGYAIGPRPEPFSDVALRQDAKGTSPGPARAARYLQLLDTVERRQRAVAEAHTRSNISGGIYSNNVASAVDALLRAIAAGREDEMLYGEKFAHDAREAEKALRQATGNANAIYYPVGLRKY